MPKIVALTKVLEDPETLAESRHHVLRNYLVDLEAKTTQATFANYAKAGAVRPVSHRSIGLTGMPPAGADVQQWICGCVLAQADAANPFSGCEAVYEADPAPAPEPAQGGAAA